MEDIADNLQLACGLELDLVLLFVLLPTTLVLILVFPLRGEPGARLGFNVIPPHIVGAFTVRPNVLTSDTARVAADALVQMEHHADLRSYVHPMPFVSSTNSILVACEP